jgi:hypothetical protein
VGGGRRAKPGVLRRGAASRAQPECYGGVRQVSSEQSRACCNGGRCRAFCGGGRGATTTARTGLRMSSAHWLGGLRRFLGTGVQFGMEGCHESPALVVGGDLESSTALLGVGGYLAWWEAISPAGRRSRVAAGRRASSVGGDGVKHWSAVVNRTGCFHEFVGSGRGVGEVPRVGVLTTGNGWLSRGDKCVLAMRNPTSFEQSGTFISVVWTVQILRI